MNGYGIAAFRSRQQVMRLEGALKRAGVNARVISTPREVAVGCGLSVQFDLKDMPAVQAAVFKAEPSNLIGLFRVESENGRKKLTAISKRG